MEHDRCWKVTRSLYFEDGGLAWKNILRQGNEELLPLTRWLMDSEDVRVRTGAELNEVK
jgi:hypothetical protein